MAEVEEPKFSTLAERIAALNQQKNFKAPPPGAAKKRPPPPPPPPPVARSLSEARSQVQPPPSMSPGVQRTPTLPARPNSRAQEEAPVLPRRTTVPAITHEDVDVSSPPLPARGAPPPLPGRSPSQHSTPALPARRPSAQFSARRDSNASEVSTISNLSLNHTVSSFNSPGPGEQQQCRRLPPTLDQANLPPLPPTRREMEARAKEEATNAPASQPRSPLPSPRSNPRTPQLEALARPSLPPRLPSRPARSPAPQQPESQAPSQPPRRLPPPPASYVRTSPRPIGQDTMPPPVPQGARDAPPPVPVASRPSQAQISAVATRAAAQPPAPPRPAGCMICRDFSGPDTVAAQHPSEAIPRGDPISYLAHNLCGPFASPTDKARAIFTWCHHNIAYDVEGFFGGCIQRLSPADTVFAGKAVCSGYAGVYEEIARRAGLDCITVTGHGKGYGFAPLRPGQAPPPRKADGHAWNAVRIDGGEWHLLDACWGAGSVGDGRFKKAFSPRHFIYDNDKFGMIHFPADDGHQFRADGSVWSWEQYMRDDGQNKAGGRATLYNNYSEEGLSEWTIAPWRREIAVRGGDEVVRFQFSKVCEHWTHETHGGGRKPYLFMMSIHGPDGRSDDLVCLDHDGFWWYVDIAARDLGAPGQKISLYGLETLDNKPARGVTKQHFLGRKGKAAMSWVGIAAWELV